MNSGPPSDSIISSKTHQRRLTVLSLAAATFFIVSGGPYGLEGVVHGLGYGRALGLMVLVPLVWSLPVAVLVGELGAALPATGGFYVWVRRGLGPFWGLQVAWVSMAATILGLAIYPVLLIHYLAGLWPSFSGLGLGERGWMLALGMIVGCFAWNASGIRAVGHGTELLGFFILSPFAVMVALALVGLPSGGFERSAEALKASSPGDASWVSGLIVCMWGYMGWDSASTFAAEVDDPGRSYPIAMLLGIAGVAACYTLPLLAATTTGLGPENWAPGTWVEVANQLGGRWLGVLVVAAGAVALVGTYSAILLSWSRLPVALAEKGLLPSVFAHRTGRSRAPVISLAAASLFCAACVNFDFDRLVQFNVFL